MSNSVVTDMQQSFGYAGTEGFAQQSFLGASIRSFQTSAGFGDTTSTLSVELADDEYHASDGLGLGLGVDLYHNGAHDSFNPPNVGSPVYFKMGLNPLSIEQGWGRTYNELYGNFFTPEYDSFVFGGVLQDVNQTKDTGGNPLYNVSVSDPREILSNCMLILNNYAGTTYNNKNLFNIYGFLEYDPSDTLKADFDSSATATNILTRTPTGYTGDDTYEFPTAAFSITNRPPVFPITGRGFSRRTEQGMPWYRISQAMKSLLNYDGALPSEYVDAGFGGVIDFRGFKYVIDFSGLPLDRIPQMYFVDYDQVDLFSLLQELCESISHQMLVSLMPVINHTATDWLWQYNNYQITLGDPNDVIAGIIRIDAIDKSEQPNYGVVRTHLNNLQASGVEVESTNLGYELSNVTTDKFVAGAQEVGMYAFTNNKDRDHLEMRKFKSGLPNDLAVKMRDQWTLDSSLKQQVLPFYGYLGKDAVTIPKGWGPYQQILLDASSLNAYGVGAYYVATEIELRYASMSYQQWMFFLRRLNEAWVKDSANGWQYSNFPEVGTMPPDNNINNGTYAVHVPRCVFDSDQPELSDAGLPKSPCSPPYGFPLYYKRLENIGMFLGTIGLANTRKNVLSNIKESLLRNKSMSNAERETLQKYGVYSKDVETVILNVERKISHYSSTIRKLSSEREKAEYNTRKVYEFVKGVADQRLGRSFLVKVPKNANLDFADTTTISAQNEILTGPFGFRADDLGKTLPSTSPDSIYTDFLDYDLAQYTDGALKANYNPINQIWEYNYAPETQGGYFSEDTHELVASQMLAPKDNTNFSENGRWSAYVRFDHSENLDLSALGADNVSQERITVNGSIPDVLEEMDNISTTTGSTISAAKLEGYNKGTTVPYAAFVKCEIDPRLCMTPKVVEENVKVHARGAAKIPNYGVVYKKKNGEVTYSPEPIIVPVNALTGGDRGDIDDTDNYTAYISKFQRVYDATSQSHLIDTNVENLDSDHVYAVVTLPAKVIPTESYRFVNINKTATNGLDYITDAFYNRGVVKDLDGFDSPPPRDDIASEAEALRLKKIDKVSTPEAVVNASAPSPVYPDLFVLPLASTERCYGPWLSSTFSDSRTRHDDIGGKVEFVKDENLAPWNYAGYTLMNEAGQLGAQFSNSLLLFAEKGSYTVPGLPLNMSLGKTLLTGGPLVTSISVNVDDNVKTTIQMDMFSAEFGKMKQQREDSLAQLARDRQKVRDLSNKLSKNGARIQASQNSVHSKVFDALHKTSMQTGNTVYDVLVSTVVKRDQDRIKVGDTLDDVTETDYYNSVAIQSRGYLDEVMTINPDDNNNRSMVKNSAGAHLSQVFSPYDELPYNGNMPSVPYVHTQAIQERTS